MKKLSVLFLGLMLASAAFAGEGDKSDGCGLGWSVTKKHSLSATTTRGTTNAFLPPTFSMTSGTSNCDKHSFAKRQEAAAAYAMANHEALRLEMAAGGGEFMEGFARTFGCNDKGAALLSAAVQKNYGRLFANEATALEMSERVEAIIKGDRTLSAACGGAANALAMNAAR